jgi:Uncharacterized protein conserved in bacteria (DUF2188)
MRADQARLGPRSAAAVEAVRSGARAVSARVLGARSRTARERGQSIERRLPLDPGVSAAARGVVAEAFGGRVAPPVVDRAQRVVSDLVSHGLLHRGGSSGEVTVRSGVGRAACRIEVESDAPARAEVGHPCAHTLTERWGFEHTADGATRIWAELPAAEASAGEHADAATLATVGAPPGEAADVHVVPNERTATWKVYDSRTARPMSEHATETEAEAAARICASGRGKRRIVIHDRYHRVREKVFDSRE